jgi:predicted DNA-binding transcriptional regulator AlpA
MEVSMEVEQKPRRIIPAKECDRRAGTTPALRWRLEKREEFPARIRITNYRIGYYEDEINRWIESRPRGGAVAITPKSPGRLGKRGCVPEAA